jgi:hypothetical protein
MKDPFAGAGIAGLSGTEGKDEGRRLLSLFESMRLHGARGYQWERWSERADRVLGSADLESVRGEARLDRLSIGLRSLWLRYAHGFAERHFRSPPLDTIKMLPSGRRLGHTYERFMYPFPLEEAGRRYRSAPDGCEVDHVVFRSGISAIAAILQLCAASTRRITRSPATFVSWSSYFETRSLLRMLAATGSRWHHAESQDALYGRLSRGEADVVLVEPVAYELLEPLNHARFLEAWNSGAGRARILVIDTTLTGELWPLRRLLAGMVTPPWVTAQVSSLIKLDQQGLEFSNGGLVSLFGDSDAVTSVAEMLRKTRSVMGTGPTYYEVAALDLPVVLDRQSHLEYCAAVFSANEVLARSVAEDNRLFSRIDHPSLRRGPDVEPCVAPFVLFHLPGAGLDTYIRLQDLVDAEARRMGLTLVKGASFGFRSHRTEAIGFDVAAGRAVLKVAMGARSGPSASRVTELMRAIAAVDSVDALFRAHGGHS